MRRILGERNQNNNNAVAALKAASPVFEEWKAVHEVNRADIGNNGSFLEFGEEAVDCLEADVNDEECNENILPTEAAAAPSAVQSEFYKEKKQLQKISEAKEAGFLSQEEYELKEEIDERSSIFSSDASNGTPCENDQSEVESASMEIEFSADSCSTPLHSFEIIVAPSFFSVRATMADSCSTPLPSSEVIVVAPSVPLISIEFTRERIGLTIGTRSLWRVVKWSILPALAVASYIYCPYLRYRVDKFIMQF